MNKDDILLKLKTIENPQDLIVCRLVDGRIITGMLLGKKGSISDPTHLIVQSIGEGIEQLNKEIEIDIYDIVQLDVKFFN